MKLETFLLAYTNNVFNVLFLYRISRACKKKLMFISIDCEQRNANHFAIFFNFASLPFLSTYHMEAKRKIILKDNLFSLDDITYALYIFYSLFYFFSHVLIVGQIFAKADINVLLSTLHNYFCIFKNAI